MTFQRQQAYTKCCPCQTKWHSDVPRLPRDVHVVTGENTQHDMSKVPRLPRMMMEVSKVLRLQKKTNQFNPAKVLCMSHKKTFEAFESTCECHEVPRLPRKTMSEPVWIPSVMRGVAATPIDKARPTIGEVPCCNAWIEERIHRWAGRWLELGFLG